MFKSIVPITKDRHLKKKLKAVSDFDFVKDVNLASVMVHEFSRAAPIYPIVFVEDKENDQFKPVVLLGLQEGENLFVEDGKWVSSYIPAIIRRYPFALAKMNEEGRYTICIDEQSPLVNDEEGQSLFDENGEATSVIDSVKQYLGELQQMEAFTKGFCQYLANNNLFAPLNMKVKLSNEIKNISGAYVVNEERFNSLSDEKFLEMRGKQYIPVVYSHLSSLSQVERLLKLKNKDAIDASANAVEAANERTLH
jgi:hypothetical protein